MSAWCCNVLFCTNEARSFTPLGVSLSALCAAEPGRFSSHYLGLGRFDHILVTLAQEEVRLLKPEKVLQKCTLTTSHWSCFGRVVGGSFDPASGLPAGSGQLLGVCVIKLAHGLRHQLQQMEPVAQALQQALAALPGQWLISSTTGWEDLVLLFWTHEFTTLSQVLAKVRSLQVQSVQSQHTPGVHAVLTTCTLTGVSLPQGVFDPARNEFLAHEWIKRLGSIQTSAPLDWSLRFEVRPGHMDPFYEELVRRAQEHNQPHAVGAFHNVLGQYDFRIQHQGGSQKDWLQFLGSVALPLASRPGTLVRSMETHLHINLPHCSEGQAAPSVQSRAVTPLSGSVLLGIQQHCKQFGIAPHTVEVLEATHSRLQALRGDDLQQHTFASVERLFTHLEAGLKALHQEAEKCRKKGERPPPEVESLDRDFCSWLCWMERCLADRYRGTYPLGESVITRVGTYQASHHGFLAAMDCVAQAAYDLAARSLSQQCTDQPHLPTVTVCSFIGSSPSPNILSFPHLRCAFVELPAGMIFRLHELPVLLHEVGHLFERLVSNHFKFEYKYSRGDPAMVEIQEILAEAFACSASFGSQTERYVQHRLSLTDTYLPQVESKYASSHRLITTVRMLAVDWLLKDTLLQFGDVTQAFRKFKTTIEALVKSELESSLQADARAQAEEEAKKAVGQCFDAFYRLASLYYERVEFKTMLSALRSLWVLSSDQADTRDMAFAQTFIHAESRYPADHFRFIEAMVARAAMGRGAALA